MKTIETSNSNEVQLSEKSLELSPPSIEDAVKIDAGKSHQNIKQKGRKRKIENISEEIDIVQIEKVPKKNHKSEKRPDPSIRFNYSLGHFPRIDKSRAVRCKHIGCDKKTFVSCPICEVHLCLCVIENRICFTDFHIEKE